MTIESLENRTLLAGVTILTHGLSGNITGWIKETAKDMRDRMGGANAAAIYDMTIDKVGGGLSVTAFSQESDSVSFDQATEGEIIVKLDWSSVSGIGDAKTQDVASTAVKYMLQPHGNFPSLAELPIQAIGHSRGGSLVAALSHYFGERGVWVDQMTTLDPHPIDVNLPFVDINDAKVRVYDNVIFADNYWRDGSSNPLEPDGEFVDDAHNVDLDKPFEHGVVISAHNAVTAYYDGTVDLDGTDGGDHQISDSWYGGSNPARDATGYHFSRIIGGTRPTEGLSTAFGGNAARADAGKTGTQWANIISPRVSGGTSFTASETLALHAIYGDRDTGAQVSFYLDTDHNPYNGTFFSLGKVSVGKATAPTELKFSASTEDLPQGKYFLGVKISDSNGQTKYDYRGGGLSFGPPPVFATVDNGGNLSVTGTDNGERFFLETDGATLTVKRDGFTQTFPMSSITTISVDCGAGNDTLSTGIGVPSVYAFGGDGNDLLGGGDGKDTLSGGAGKNTLEGGAGEDRLNGSGGHDELFGFEDGDRLYGNGGDDILDGGGGVDRLFGGDGNDSLLGGSSNDKLYGEAGNDTLNGQKQNDIEDGGGGTDSAFQEPADTLTSIEVILP